MLGFDTRIAKIVWTVFVIGLLLFIVFSVRQTILVVTFAIFFSYLLYPLIELAERYKPPRIPRIVSICAVFVLVLGIFAIAASLFGSQVADEASRLSQQLPSLLDVKNISDRIPLPNFLQSQRVRLVAFVSEQLQSSSGQAVPFAQKLGLGVMHAASNLIYLVLIPILSFLLIKEAPTLKREVLAWIGHTNSSLWAGIIENLDKLLAGYVRALLILSIVTFIVYSTGFTLMGVSYALLLGVVAGLLEVIPFVGPLIAAVVVVLVSAFSGYPHLLWLVVFIFAYRIFQDYVLSPYLMSAGLEVSPLMVIIGLLAGDQLGGVAGIFLAVPVLAALKIVIAEAAKSAKKTGTMRF
ncbi:MAG: AI-2E family transporter [Polaromonas sp.]|uniref:AI-2E family transporter n=1 Tax=Polaromonas sp. TaxID=1869339 RepID=UPI0017E529BC|nr:AI-2E family transporter [Polaromonas sp.]NMM09671.1 AI-2E family transporter [Polaromonas sp.]